MRDDRRADRARAQVTTEVLFETLKAVQARLGDLGEDMREVKGWLGIIVSQIGIFTVQQATLSGRIDRIEVRLDRIERRLGLIEA